MWEHSVPWLAVPACICQKCILQSNFFICLNYNSKKNVIHEIAQISQILCWVKKAIFRNVHCMILLMQNLKQTKLIYRNRNQITDCLGPGVGGWLSAKGNKDDFWGYENVLSPDAGNNHTDAYIYPNSSNYTESRHISFHANYA